MSEPVMSEPKEETCKEVSCIESAVKEIEEVEGKLNIAIMELMTQLNPVLRGDNPEEVAKPARAGECAVQRQLLAHVDRLELLLGFVYGIRGRLCI